MFNWNGKSGKLSPEELEDRAERIARNKAQMDQLEAESKELWEDLEDNLGLGEHSVGDFIIKMSESARFNEALAKSVLTPEEFAQICKPKADSTLAKKFFEDRYEEFQKPSPNSRKEIKRVL